MCLQVRFEAVSLTSGKANCHVTAWYLVRLLGDRPGACAPEAIGEGPGLMTRSRYSDFDTICQKLKEVDRDFTDVGWPGVVPDRGMAFCSHGLGSNLLAGLTAAPSPMAANTVRTS